MFSDTEERFLRFREPINSFLYVWQAANDIF